jgi:hypothetical protein
MPDFIRGIGDSVAAVVQHSPSITTSSSSSKLLANATHRSDEDRLMVLTSEHQLIEFDARDGK